MSKKRKDTLDVRRKDFARAIDELTIAHFDTMRGKVYNVGDSRINLSKLELCERIKAHVPGFTFLQAAIGEDPDKRNYIVANDRIEATGWRPSHTLDEGIEELKKLYRTLRLTQHGNV